LVSIVQHPVRFRNSEYQLLQDCKGKVEKNWKKNPKWRNEDAHFVDILCRNVLSTTTHCFLCEGLSSKQCDYVGEMRFQTF